ncbi:MAG TPA: cytidine deaminase [Planctomycetota bacterium]|nr:cytidine deaminase [Planctomycetota bacterium]
MNSLALVDAARAARNHAHAPYSRYPVGAAVLTGSGHVFTGTNVENASFGLTVCAERSAIFAMVAAGERDPVAVAVVTTDGAAPCGACRQVLREFASDLQILIARPSGDPITRTLVDLLPEPFGPEFPSSA